MEEGTLWGCGWWEDGWGKSLNFSIGLNVTFSGLLFQKRFDVLKAVNMKVMVFLNMTVKGFKKCCVSSAMDETDDDMLWNGSKEDGNVRGECEEDENTASEGGDSDTDWWR